MLTPRGKIDILPLPASAAGPDIREMVLGSEGRLGVVTQAKVRVRRVPEAEAFFGVFFPSWEQGSEAVREIVQSELPVSMLRLSNPLETATTDLIVDAKARTVAIDGYPTYMLGQFATDHDLVRSIVNVCRILAAPAVKTVVLDHHMARDYRYPAFFKLVFDKAAKSKVKFGTAAEMLGRRPVTLVLELAILGLLVLAAAGE